MIKFGHAVNYWVDNFGIDFHKALDEMALIGWDGVEMATDFLNYYLGNIDELRKLLELHNLELATFYSHLSLIYKDSSKVELNLIRGKTKLIKDLGADVLLIDGGAKIKGFSQKDCQYAVENIKKICEIAYSKNLKPTWHLHWGTIFDKEEIFEYLMENTEEDGLCFCPDTSQLVMSGMDPLKVMEKYKKRISYIHLKDLIENTFINRYLKPTELSDPQDNTLQPLATAGKYRYLDKSYLDEGTFHINSKYKIIEIARGQIDFKPIVRFIKDIDFNGWIVVDQDYTGYRNIESMDVNFRNLKYLFEEK